MKWSTSTLKKLKTKKNRDSILAIACNGTKVAFGGTNKIIKLMTYEFEPLYEFVQHKGAIQGLVFQAKSDMLYSAGNDLAVMAWDCEIQQYIKTMFGHESGVQAIDALHQDKSVSVGGRDNTPLIFNIEEDKCSKFVGSRGSIDCVKYINTSTFVTGGADDGTLALWTIDKRKPRHSKHAAHGTSFSGQANWITSLAAPSNSDMFASGSNNNQIILWSLHRQGKSLIFTSFKEMKRIEATGFINSMNFLIKEESLSLIVCTSKEHRLGRWWTDKNAKNSILKFSLVPEI